MNNLLNTAPDTQMHAHKSLLPGGIFLPRRKHSLSCFPYFTIKYKKDPNDIENIHYKESSGKMKDLSLPGSSLKKLLCHNISCYVFSTAHFPKMPVRVQYWAWLRK